MPTDVAQLYSDAFAPEYFVLGCTLAVLAYERRTGSRSGPRRVAAQLGVVGAAWAVAFAVYRGGPLALETVPSWGPDLFGSLGLAVGFLLIGGVWTVRGWGPLLPRFAALLLAVTVVHAVVVPFWDVSSHVTYAVVPAGFLASLHRRFLPVLLVPAGMVFSRVLVDAHTWAQSIGGVVLGGAFLLGMVWVRSSEAIVGRRSAT